MEDGRAERVRSVDYGFEKTLEGDDVSVLTGLFLERFDHDTPLVFFDREFNGVLGIDVFTSDFPRERGYKIYRTARADLLVIRVEDLTACAGRAMKEFLDLDDFRLVDANVGQLKEYGALYERFKKSVRLPASYLGEMYGSKYARHFYTEEELARFRRRWTRPSTID